jgi:catechol 2,3-dioxygenase-like lactoylglutathione lyase family enzyme
MATREPAYLLDHVSLPVSDLAKSKAFYAAALEPLGFGIIMESASAVGFGAASTPQDLWLGQGTPTATIHIGLHAEDEAAVHAFHAAGLAAGGTDNGQPGTRPQYHAGYYAAYLIDPDGNNLEAVYHDHQPQP